MGRIDWNRSAREIACQVRGLEPLAGSAYTALEGKPLKIYQARPLRGRGGSGSRHRWCESSAKEGLMVACGQGVLEADRNPGSRRQTHAGEAPISWENASNRAPCSAKRRIRMH